MALRRYILDVIIALIIAALIYYLWNEYKPNKNDNGFSFIAPSLEQAKQSHNYKLRLTFSSPEPLYKKTLRASIIHASGEESTGNFIVRDIRLWRTNGNRIINDEFTLPSQPLHITIYDTSDNSALFESDIDTNLTTIASSKSNVTTEAKVEITAPRQ